MHRDLTGFDWAETPLPQAQIQQLASAAFTETAHNPILLGGTGTGKTHLATALGVAAIHQGKRVRFYNAVDLVNQLEREKQQGRAGNMARQLLQEDAQTLHWDTFRHWLSAPHLKAYLRGLTGFDDVEAEQRAIDHALGHEDRNLALAFLVAWPDLRPWDGVTVALDRLTPFPARVTGWALAPDGGVNLQLAEGARPSARRVLRPSRRQT